MKTDISGYLDRRRQHIRRRQRAAAFLTALSLLVSTSVSWQLRGIGSALDDDAAEQTAYEGCTIEEHTHTDECYEYQLICGQDGEEDHEHTDECYEKVLICGKEEHIHSEACDTGQKTDPETEEIWEATLPEEYTDSVGENVALTAESQLGYTEGPDSYSRYGEWYGSPQAEWNTMFTFFCMYYGGVDRETVPYGSGAEAWTVELRDAGLLNEIGEAQPVRGDVILTDTDLDGRADRSAVVTGKAEDALEVIEGDSEGTVAKIEIAPDDEHILGYVSLETSDGSQTFEESSASGIKVIATAEKGAFPDNTTMTVTDIDDTEAEETAQAAAEEDQEIADAVAVDITFTDENGTEIEPEEGKEVRVQIILPESKIFDEGEYSLLHVSDDGSVEKITDASVTAEGAEFKTESFSIYIMTSTGKLDIDTATRIRLGDETIEHNSAENRYVVQVGDLIDVYAQVTSESDGFWVGSNEGDAGNVLIRWNNSGNLFTPNDDGFEEEAHYVARRAGDCTINCNGHEPLYLKVESSPMMLSTVQGMLPNTSETYQLLNKQGGPPWWPYHYYLGDYITFTAYVDPANPDQTFTLNNNNGVLTEISNNVAGTINGLDTVSAVYRVDKATEGENYVEVHFGSDWLRIHAIYPVYVKTTLSDRNIDMENEWLNGMGLPKQNGYVPNSSDYPYEMHVGDTVELYGYDTEEGVMFTSETVGSEETVIEQVGTQTNVLTDTQYKTTVKFEAKAPGLAKVDYGDNRTVYIKVIDNSVEEEFTHADIEISDGGKYSYTTVEYRDGKKIATVKVYDSYITAVNRCILYDKDGNVIVPTKINGAPTDGDDVSFVPDDYYQNGEPGQPQYELTSQYKIVNDEHVYSIKRYKGSDVQTALFDVKLTLKPSYQFTITTEGDQETVSEASPLTGSDEVVESTLFHMNHQDVIDAFNKCPNHSGLDFTIRASMALTEVEAVKTLNGGTLSGNDFTFAIVDGSGTTIATALNDPDGIVKFDNLHFEAAGSFDYYLKEVIPAQQEDIRYDPRQYTLHITVRDLGNGVMSAELDVQENTSYEFENMVLYTLPNTGGPGIIPYAAGGTGLIMLSAVLFWYKKRREAG